MPQLIQLVVAVLIVGVLVWAIDQLPMIDPAFKKVARVILIVALAIWAIIVIASLVGYPITRWTRGA
jgi:hypothetical protein